MSTKAARCVCHARGTRTRAPTRSDTMVSHVAYAANNGQTCCASFEFGGAELSWPLQPFLFFVFLLFTPLASLLFNCAGVAYDPTKLKHPFREHDIVTGGEYEEASFNVGQLCHQVSGCSRA